LPVVPPTAAISGYQMCLAWDATQVCALVESQLRADLQAGAASITSAWRRTTSAMAQYRTWKAW
jgi:hypothetical protein